MCNNRLKLNGDKTHLMLLASDRSWRTKLTEDSLGLITEPNTPRINSTRKENILGCLVSQNLKWTEHLLLNEKSLVKKLTCRLNALKLIGSVANFKTRLMFANGLFMSKLAYAMPVWGGCEDFLIRSLQVVQNKAARLVCRKGIYTPIETLLTECNWLSVAQLVVFHSIVLLYKVQKSQRPSYLFHMFTSERRYATRGENHGKLQLFSMNPPAQKLNCRSFRWRSLQTWNQLPANIRQIDNIDEFKSKLKTWIREHVEI